MADKEGVDRESKNVCDKCHCTCSSTNICSCEAGPLWKNFKICMCPGCHVDVETKPGLWYN